MQFKSHAKVIHLPYLPVILSRRIYTFENAADIHFDRVSVDSCKAILGYTTDEDQHIAWHKTKNEMLDAFLPSNSDVKTYIIRYVSLVIEWRTELTKNKLHLQ